MPWDRTGPRVRVVERVFGSRSLRLCFAQSQRACVVTAVASVGLWSVPDDDWALPGQSSDCLHLRACAGQRHCMACTQCTAVQGIINLPRSAVGLAWLQYPYAVRTLTIGCEDAE